MVSDFNDVLLVIVRRVVSIFIIFTVDLSQVLRRDIERFTRVLVVAVVDQELSSREIDHLSPEEGIDLLVIHLSLCLTGVSDSSGIPLVLVIAATCSLQV